MSSGFKPNYALSATLLDREGLHRLCVVNNIFKRECVSTTWKGGRRCWIGGNACHTLRREVIYSLKKEAEIKVNDCEVIRALALCRFSTMFPREVKLNNCMCSSKSDLD